MRILSRLWVVLVLLTASLTAAADSPPQLAYLHPLPNRTACRSLLISDVYGDIKQQFDLPLNNGCVAPIWSPDGNYLAAWFPNIVLINLQTSTTQVLTHPSDGWGVESAVWSHNGSYLAWHEQRKGSTTDFRWKVIYIPNDNVQTFSDLSDVVVPPDEIHIIRFHDGAYYLEQTAKPSQKIAPPYFVHCWSFIQLQVDQLQCLTESAFILIDPANRHNTFKVDKNTRIQYPVWSPDRSQIVYQAQDTSAQKYWLEIMSSDGSNPRKLATPPDDTNDILPQWSTDGQYIAFQRRSTSKGQLSKVYVIKADGSGLQYIDDGIALAWRPLPKFE